MAVRTVVSAVLLTLVVTGCSAASVPSAGDDASVSVSASAADILADFGYDAADPRALVDDLDALPVADRPTDLMASVRPTELLLTAADGREASLPLPADEFYLSLAPYVDSTHDCHFHSLTTCRGELANTDVEVTARDTATGEVLVDGVRRTFDNGFLGLWLPRGITAELTVIYDGRTAATTVSTDADDDATCLTTLQLT